MEADTSARVEKLRGALRRVPAGAGTEEVFRALESVVSLQAGFVDHFFRGQPAGGVTTFYKVSEPLSERIMETRAHDSAIVLQAVALAPCGLVLRDRDLASVINWKRIASHRALLDAGFAHAAAMKVREAPVGRDHEHTYVAIIRRKDNPPLSRSDCQVLKLCCRDLAEALERARAPLISSEPILAQVAEEQRLGLCCISTSKTSLLETNRLAHVYAADYGPVLGLVQEPNMLHRFVHALFRKRRSKHHTPPSAWMLVHPTKPRMLSVRRHLLCKEAHAIHESVNLLVMQEFDLDRLPAEQHPLRPLPPRLQQVAHYLVNTGLSYKQIAVEMGLKLGTVRTHVGKLYRALQVPSRSALVELLKDR